MVRLIGTISLVLALLSVTLLVLMRFSDGPVGMLSGGGFRTVGGREGGGGGWGGGGGASSAPVKHS